MALVNLRRDGDVFVVEMCDGGNRFRPEFLAELEAAIDEAESSSGAAALVTTGQGKFYTNGLDLDWVIAAGDEGRTFVADMLRVFARVLSSPLPTAAAINGHAFAGGAMFALAHDYRVMRSDRGYFCLPEADLGVPLVDGMTALIREKIGSGPVLRDAVLAGERFASVEAVAASFVDVEAPEDGVLDAAIALVAPLAGKDRSTRQALKRGLYAATLAVLEDPVASVATPRLG